MENILLRVSRSTFPLSKFYLNVGDENFIIRSGEEIIIPLKNTGKYNFNISLFWIKKKFNLDLDSNSEIKIKHAIPDVYYILSSFLLIILAFLSFFSMINSLILPIALLLYVSPLIYFTFLNKKNYFKIEINE